MMERSPLIQIQPNRQNPGLGARSNLKHIAAPIGSRGFDFSSIGMFFFLILLFIGPNILGAQTKADNRPELRTGNSLERHLRTPISATISEVPVKTWLHSFVQQQRVALFLDRRIDPGTPISVSLQNATVEQLLWTIAETEGWGVCRLGDFYYIGPAEITAALPILWDQIKNETRQQTRDIVVAWNSASDFSIPELSSPGHLLNELAKHNHFTISGGSLPHDLWSVVELPKLPLDEQVALLLIGFGKWYERSADGQQVLLIKFPQVESGSAEFGVVENSRQVLKDLQTRFPDCRISRRGKTIAATGTPDQLAAIQQALVKIQRPVRTHENADVRFTLSTHSSRKSILATIAQQTGRQLDFDPSLNEILNEQIELTVKDVSLQELIEKTLDGSGVGFVLEEQQLKIQRK